MSTQPRLVPGRKQTACTEHNVTTPPPIRRACATHPYALYCRGWLCLSEPVVRDPPSTSLCCRSMCDRSMRTQDGNVRTVWIQYEYLNCPYTSDVLCFLPEAHPINLDIRQHAMDTNNATPPPISGSTSSSGPHHALAAGLWCTAVASCFIGGCGPASVITISLSSAALLYVCAL